MRGPQKPFVVEVKRGRKNGVAPRSPSWPQPKEPAFSAAAARRQAAPPAATPMEPAPVEPQRRILEAIEPPPVENAVVRAATAEKPAPRRGRPAKGVRPAAASRKERPVSRGARPPDAAGAETDRTAVAAPPPAAEASPSPAGRVAHGGRAEKASALPRGDRWKRRLPKVLW